MKVDNKNMMIKAKEIKTGNVYRVVELHFSKTGLIDKCRITDESRIFNYYRDNTNNHQVDELELTMN